MRLMTWRARSSRPYRRRLQLPGVFRVRAIQVKGPASKLKEHPFGENEEPLHSIRVTLVSDHSMMSERDASACMKSHQASALAPM
jgi:hypothetical protein